MKSEVNFMVAPKNLEASLDGLEIGAISPENLQVVFQADGHCITLKLTADEARWLASALNHWADQSRLIKSN